MAPIVGVHDSNLPHRYQRQPWAATEVFHRSLRDGTSSLSLKIASCSSWAVKLKRGARSVYGTMTPSTAVVERYFVYATVQSHDLLHAHMCTPQSLHRRRLPLDPQSYPRLHSLTVCTATHHRRCRGVHGLTPCLSRRTHLHCPAARAPHGSPGDTPGLAPHFQYTTHRQRQRDLVPIRSNEICSIPHCIGTSHLLSVTTQGTLSVLYLDFADLTEQWYCTHADAALRRFLQTASHSAARFARANTHATIGLKSSTHV